MVTMLRYTGESNTMFTHGCLYEPTPEDIGMYRVWLDDGVGYATVDSDLVNTEGYPWEYEESEIDE